MESCSVVNFQCVMPKANFNEEKQMLLVAYSALLARTISTYFEQKSLVLNYQK